MVRRDLALAVLLAVEAPLACAPSVAPASRPATSAVAPASPTPAQSSAPTSPHEEVVPVPDAIDAATPSSAAANDRSPDVGTDRVDAATPSSAPAVRCRRLRWEEHEETLEGRVAFVQGQDEDGTRATFVVLQLTTPICRQRAEDPEPEIEIVRRGEVRGSESQHTRWRPYLGRLVRVRGTPWSLEVYARVLRWTRMMVRSVEDVDGAQR